jgi:hypothetical protein
MDANTSDSDHMTIVLEVFYIIFFLAPFDFGISLLHPQGREPLMFLNRDELWKILPVAEESWKHRSGSAICIHSSHNNLLFFCGANTIL